jgi:Tfp pilus assembly protein PilF
LKTLIQAQPKLSGAYLNLALVYVETNRPADADVQFKKAIEVNPDNMTARDQYGIWLRTQGRFKDAEANYLQALQRQPNHANTHLNLGILYDLYLGKSVQALEQYQQYLSLQGETPAPEAEKVKSWVAELQRRNKGAS